MKACTKILKPLWRQKKFILASARQAKISKRGLQHSLKNAPRTLRENNNYTTPFYKKTKIAAGLGIPRTTSVSRLSVTNSQPTDYELRYPFLQALTLARCAIMYAFLRTFTPLRLTGYFLRMMVRVFQKEMPAERILP